MQTSREAPSDVGRRAGIAWRLLLASALLIFPVLILLPLAYAWRGGARRTVFASHFRAVIRYGWLLVIMPCVAVFIPSDGVAIILVLVTMFSVGFAAIGGYREAWHSKRYETMFA